MEIGGERGGIFGCGKRQYRISMVRRDRLKLRRRNTFEVDSQDELKLKNVRRGGEKNGKKVEKRGKEREKLGEI